MHTKRTIELTLWTFLLQTAASLSLVPTGLPPVVRELTLALSLPRPPLDPENIFYPPLSLPVELSPSPPLTACRCVVHCCKHVLQKRRAATLAHDMPLVRHKRCCGCQVCGTLAYIQQ